MAEIKESKKWNNNNKNFIWSLIKLYFVFSSNFYFSDLWKVYSKRFLFDSFLCKVSQNFNFISIKISKKHQSSFQKYEFQIPSKLELQTRITLGAT